MVTMIAMQTKDIPPIRHREGMALAETEYQRFLDMLRSLQPDDWAKPTVCTRWDVKGVAAHILGEAEGLGSMREFAHQWRPARREARAIGEKEWVHGVNEIQVRERAHLSTEELIERFETAAPGAVRGRRRFPLPLRVLPMKFPPPIGWMTLGYLYDRVLTRDPWMHRVDIARATGRELVLTAEHDGRLIADMVSEWADTHDQPFTLVLDGPAGGTYTRGAGGDVVEIDAIEFIWILSGRATGEGLLAHPLPL